MHFAHSRSSENCTIFAPPYSGAPDRLNRNRHCLPSNTLTSISSRCPIAKQILTSLTELGCHGRVMNPLLQLFLRSMLEFHVEHLSLAADDYVQRDHLVQRQVLISVNAIPAAESLRSNIYLAKGSLGLPMLSCNTLIRNDRYGGVSASFLRVFWITVRLSASQSGCAARRARQSRQPKLGVVGASPSIIRRISS
jgi:hypothetical protein